MLKTHTLNTLVKTGLYVTSLCIVGFWSSISTADIRPFEATYTSTWDLGISLSGKAHRSLIQNDDGSLRLTTNASAMVASLNESSLFNYQDNQIIPLHYTYLRKILNKTRTVEVAFDWPNHKVTNTAQGSDWTMAIVPHTQDKQSVQMRLQLDLASTYTATGQAFSYDVADGGQLKTYKFVADGTDKVDTPLGQFQAVRVKRDRGEDTSRQTWIWFAPEIDFTIVKILQQEADGKRYQLNLKTLQWL